VRNIKICSVIAEKNDRSALSGIAVQHAVDDYSRCGNFGCSLGAFAASFEFAPYNYMTLIIIIIICF